VTNWQVYNDITAFHGLTTFVLQLQKEKRRKKERKKERKKKKTSNNSFPYLDSHAVYAILSTLVE